MSSSEEELSSNNHNHTQTSSSLEEEWLIPLDHQQRMQRRKDPDMEQAKLVYNTIEKCRRDTEYVLEHDVRTKKLLQAVQQHCDSRVLSEVGFENGDFSKHNFGITNNFQKCWKCIC